MRAAQLERTIGVRIAAGYLGLTAQIEHSICALNLIAQTVRANGSRKLSAEFAEFDLSGPLEFDLG
jgi:hypothetical protein